MQDQVANTSLITMEKSAYEERTRLEIEAKETSIETETTDPAESLGMERLQIANSKNETDAAAELANMLNSVKSSDSRYAISKKEEFRKQAWALYRQPSKTKILDSKRKEMEYNKLKCMDVVDLLSWRPQVPPSEREKLRRIRLWENGLISMM